MTSQTKSKPRNILIVEDEMLIALDIEQMLIELGHTIVALCSRVPAAIIAAGQEEIDFAVLDINVAGVPSFPVAQVLLSRGVPFVFLSGYGSRGLIQGFTDSLVLTKPFRLIDLQLMLESAVAVEVKT